MHPGWLSNAYVVADEEGGTAVFVDSGAPLEPLVQALERWEATPACLLRTHSHADHVEFEPVLCERYGIEVVIGAFEAGGLRVEALETPGHADDHLAFVVNGEVCFSGDILFRDAVGGGPDAEPIRHSVMDVVMTLPPDTRVMPGHTGETAIQRELEHNPFVRYWNGDDDPVGEAVTVRGAAATLLVWSPDYDGKGKALVRWDDGREAIVGGSSVQRAG